MQEKLLKIINHYGVTKQLKYFQSEVFELNEAVIKYELFDNIDLLEEECVDNIIEEIADVMVMLEQFKLYYGISSEELTKIFWEKVDRTLERIEKEGN